MTGYTLYIGHNSGREIPIECETKENAEDLAAGFQAVLNRYADRISTAAFTFEIIEDQ